MVISLPPDIEANIRQKVEAGHFADAGDVVREAMRLLDDQERLLAPIRVKLRAGLDQLDGGEGDSFTPELVARMRLDANERFRKGDRPNPDVCP